MILVTGASGLIGRALVKVLSESGLPIRAHVRSRDGAAVRSWHSTPGPSVVGTGAAGQASAAVMVKGNVDIVEADFAQASAAQYEALVSGCQTIIHTAGLVHAANAASVQFDQLNTQATKLLLEASNRAGVREFVFFSSSAVYGQAFELAAESHSLQPTTLYAASKMACENILQAECAAARLVILRPSLIFGAGDRGNMLALIRQINKGRYVDIAGNTARKSVIAAADVVNAVQLCLNLLPDGRHTFNLANPYPVEVRQLSGAIARCLSRPAPPVVPRALLGAGAAVAETVLGKRSPLTRDRLDKLSTSTTLDVARLVQQTGFVPQSTLDCALAAEIEWARSQNLI